MKTGSGQAINAARSATIVDNVLAMKRLPASIVMVLMLHVSMSSNGGRMPMPAVLGRHGRFRHERCQATKRQGCSSSDAG